MAEQEYFCLVNIVILEARKNMIHPLLWIKERGREICIRHYRMTPAGRRLSGLKDKYKGQRCFIIANGPSLEARDLDLLWERGEITFGMNRIYKMFERTVWRPTFYVCEDELIAQSQQAEINAIEAAYKFLPIELKWYHNVDIKDAVYFHINYDNEKRYRYAFSSDMADQVECRGTVTFTCMQFAAYMGFSKIYLLGVDHNYRVTVDINGNQVVDPTAKDYFCEDYDKDIKDIAVHDMGNNTRAYMDARRYFEETKCSKIYNATRGGKLEVFQRVDFDSLFTEEKRQELKE